MLTRIARATPRLSLAARPLITPRLSAVAGPRAPFIVAGQRWYSDAKEDVKKEEATSEEGKTEEPAEVTELKKKLETKTKEAQEFKDGYLRAIADFRNLQDRTTRDIKAAKTFAISSFAKDLVDSVDNLDRALSTVPAAKQSVPADSTNEYAADLANLYEGLKMTEDILMNTLKKHGLERFDPTGEKFNPNEHDATFMAPQADKENDTVFHVQSKGFRLNGRVLRAAKVGVVKNA